MIIRDVKINDAGAIAGIYLHYVKDTTVSFETIPPDAVAMAERIRSISTSYPYLVAEDENTGIVGYCYAHPWKERAAYSQTWETTIYLSPDFTGREIGHTLMRRLISACRDYGCHALIACITAENTGSIAFHGSLGFREVSRFIEVGFKFGRYLDVVDMELML